MNRAAQAFVARWLAAVTVAASLLPFQSRAPGANLALIDAPRAWGQGATGRGVVVAVLDSGVDLSQPDLARAWRGGPNSWFDPYGQHPEQPVDLTGHGTQVLGVILGGEVDGVQVGVAPDAQWIAARIFDDAGNATPEALHAALRWVLDPDGDPATADGADVVNSSWTSEIACDPEFAPDLRALRAAGVLPVFAAGTREALSPATLPEAFPVGALSGATTLSDDSPPGPARCGVPGIFPQLVAPGVDIVTTDRDGLPTLAAGTSVAAAHVSGALALLLSAQPGLSADEQADLLRRTAVDLGAPGPDLEFGYGRLNAGAAVREALAVPQRGRLAGALFAALGGAWVLVILILRAQARED